MKAFRLNSNVPGDRREVFEELCKANNLDIKKEAEKIGIEDHKTGLNVTIEKLFLFLYRNKMAGSFNFEEKTIIVFFEDKPVIGNKAVNNPEKIKDSDVDDVPVDDDELDLPF